MRKGGGGGDIVGGKEEEEEKRKSRKKTSTQKKKRRRSRTKRQRILMSKQVSGYSLLTAVGEPNLGRRCWEAAADNFSRPP